MNNPVLTRFWAWMLLLLGIFGLIKDWVPEPGSVSRYEHWQLITAAVMMIALGLAGAIYKPKK